MSRVSAFCDWLLRLPLLWGGVAYLGFYFLISSGYVGNALIVRYCDGHPVERIEVALAFVGFSALLIRFLSLAPEFGAVGRKVLGPAVEGGQPTDDAADLLLQLSNLPDFMQRTILVQRIRNAIEHIHRKDSADSLESHLRHLEDADRDRVYNGHALVRIVIWAIPILGFLGTVIGITVAIARLDAKALEQSMDLVTSGLGVAFDTTALALALSIGLMFTKFCVERVEHRLLAMVDDRTESELVGRFHQTGSAADPNVTAIRRMSEQVVRAVETVTARQIQLWKSTIDETHQQWALVSAATGKVVEESLAKSLSEHAASLSEGVRKHLETLNRGVEQHAVEISRGSGQMIGQLRDGLEKMAELLVEALQKHGEVLTAAEVELAQENRKHLTEVEAALGEAMVVAADRQEKLIARSEELLKEMQIALVEAAGSTVEHQEQLVKQGEILLQVVDATGQVKHLEEALNSNLASLGRAHDFEETLLSLSAAIQLLSARVGREPASRPTIEVDPSARKSQAA